MTYTIENQAFGIIRETAEYCCESEKVADAIGEDFFWDILREAFSNLEVVPDGTFIKAVIDQKLYMHTIAYIDGLRNDLQFNVKQFSDAGEQIDSMNVSMVDYMLRLVDEDRSDCSWDCRINSYIESCLESFVESASWHVGVMGRNTEAIRLLDSIQASKMPDDDYIIIWYGLDYPIMKSPWVITRETENMSFWFNETPWTFMEAISDLNEGSLIWYTAECNNWTPNMASIREKCPLVFSEDESGETVLRRIREV